MSPTFYFDAEKAICDAVRAGNFSIPMGFPDAELSNPDAPLWGQVHNMRGERSPVTLGVCGEDNDNGFVQIDLNTVKGNGSGDILLKAGEIVNFFASGDKLVYNTVTVNITTSSVSPGRYVGGLYRVSITINYYVRSQRNN